MKNLLMVVTHYAPLNISGTLRAVKFSQDLPDFGWNVHVLRPVRYLKILYPDQSRPIPDGVIIHTVPHFAPSEFLPALVGRMGINPLWIVMPDAMRFWYLFAVRKGIQVVEKHRIDAIFCTVPQYTGALVAAEIARRTSIPFVYDVRDSWNREPELHPMPTAWHQRRNLAMERRVVKISSTVTTVRQALVSQYQQDYPNANVRQISHGFDPSDIPSADYIPHLGELHLIHLGTIYRGSNNRHPDTVFHAIRNLIDRSEIPQDKVHIAFVGNAVDAVSSLVNRFELTDSVQYIPQQPYLTAVQKMLTANVLLMIERTNSIPNKFYEYLATGLPTLILSDNAEIQQIVTGYTDNSYVLSPNDTTAIESALLDMYRNPRLNSKLQAYRARFSRRGQAEQLATLLDELTV